MNIEDQLQSLQIQVWVLMALILLFIAINIYFHFNQWREQKNSPSFSELWDKGKIDKIIKLSRKQLEKYPNHSEALYFGARALMSKIEHLDEARKSLKQLLIAEPSLRESTQELIDEIDKRKNS